MHCKQLINCTWKSYKSIGLFILLEFTILGSFFFTFLDHFTLNPKFLKELYSKFDKKYYGV